MAVAVSSSDAAVQDMQDQINGGTRQYGISPGGALPSGVSPYSLATQQTATTLNFHVADSRGVFGNAIQFPKTLTLYTGLTESASGPATSDLPSDGSFGWHLNTTSGRYAFAYNDSGTIIFPNLTYISGTITNTQHGNLAGQGGTDHDLTQISGNISVIPGSITLSQHGDLSGLGGTSHGFGQISGTITIAQHGALGNLSGTAHLAVTTSVDGFMSASDKTKLNNYPADCTTVATDSNAVQRSSGAVAASQFNAVSRYTVGANQVVGAQRPAIADATNAADVITQLNLWLASARAHGLIGP